MAVEYLFRMKPLLSSLRPHRGMVAVSLSLGGRPSLASAASGGDIHLSRTPRTAPGKVES
jgi:hypothetical protein